MIWLRLKYQRGSFCVCSADILLDDGYEGNLRKEGRSVRIVVNISRGPKTTKVTNSCCSLAFCTHWMNLNWFRMLCHEMISSLTQATQCQEYLIGSIGVSGKTKWDVLDGVIRRLFKVKVLSNNHLVNHIHRCLRMAIQIKAFHLIAAHLV